MKITCLLILLLCSISLNAQNASQLAGTWGYQEVYEQEELDSSSITMLNMLFGNMSLAFSENGKYAASIMGQSDSGSWELNEAKENLHLNSASGETSTFQVFDLNEDRLVLRLSKGAFVFKRTGDAPASIDLPDPAIETVSVTKDQIAKKWYLKRKEAPGKSEKQIEMVNNLIAGAYFDFQKDGTFEVRIMGMTEAGNWKLGSGNTSVITASEDAQKTWKISKITQEELVLHAGNSEEKWIFSTLE